jgi:predicted oxidoreductase (fatty acid repression mutant protein)
VKFTINIEARHAKSEHCYALVRTVEAASTDEARKVIREAVARFGVVPSTFDENGKRVWLLTNEEVAHIKPDSSPENIDHGDDLV